jgi:exonuclease SbcC
LKLRGNAPHRDHQGGGVEKLSHPLSQRTKRMIKTVELEDFQSHSHSVLEFSPGVNVIKGTSHSGKSSIIRALKWALFNEPRGLTVKPFKKPSSTLTSVGIEFEGGSYIIRKRSGTENKYEVNGEELEAMGREKGVPEEVSLVTQMTPLNLQTQEEEFFLLRESSGQVARLLNEHIGLEVIDEKLAKANEIVNETRRNLSSTIAAIGQTEEEIKKYEGLNKCEALLAEVERIEEEVEELGQKSQLLNYKIKSLEASQEKLAKVEAIHRRIRRIYEVHISPKLPEYRSSVFEFERKQKVFLSIQRDIERSTTLRKNLDIRLSNLKAERDKLYESYNEETCPKCGALRRYWGYK